MRTTNLRPYPTITTIEVYEIANGLNTRASTTITILATTNITTIAATRDVVGSLVVIVIKACATSTFNRTTASINSEATTYLIR